MDFYQGLVVFGPMVTGTVMLFCLAVHHRKHVDDEVSG